MDDHHNMRKDNIDNHTSKKLIICPKMLTTMSYEVVMDDYNDLRKDNIIIHTPKLITYPKKLIIMSYNEL